MPARHSASQCYYTGCASLTGTDGPVPRDRVITFRAGPDLGSMGYNPLLEIGGGARPAEEIALGYIGSQLPKYGVGGGILYPFRHHHEIQRMRHGDYRADDS